MFVLQKNVEGPKILYIAAFNQKIDLAGKNQQTNRKNEI